MATSTNICALYRVVLHSVAIIPYGISYLLPRETCRDDGGAGASRWSDPFQNWDWTPNCLLYSPHAHSDHIQLSTASGCHGATANIWLHNGQILVGSSVRHLDAQYTLQQLYLDSLLARFEGQTDSLTPADDSFVLLLNLRTSIRALWPHLVSQIESLREAGHLTHLNGSRVVPGRLTVVATGQASVDKLPLIDGSYNDIFFDDSLDELVLEDYESPFGIAGNGLSDRSASLEGGGFRPQSPALRNVYCATANFKESIGIPHRGRFSRQQIELIRAQVRAAHQRGLRVRYEGSPQGSQKLQYMTWRVLEHEGADLVEMNWRGYEHGWWWR